MASKDRCLARLTSWERTNCAIGDSNRRASIVRLCKNIPEKDKVLCQECLERPVESKYQTRMMHGLLSEPPSEGSHVYGSSWYWQQVAMYGETVQAEWISRALKAQKDAEEFCGLGGWKVQRPSAKEFLEMQKRKKKDNKEAAANRVAVVEAKKGTLLQSFPVIRVMYQESEKVPEKLPTDSCAIWKDVKEGDDVWVSEAGHVFACNTVGGIGELLSGDAIPK